MNVSGQQNVEKLEVTTATSRCLEYHYKAFKTTIVYFKIAAKKAFKLKMHSTFAIVLINISILEFHRGNGFRQMTRK